MGKMVNNENPHLNNRTLYNKDMFTFVVGDIGKLQTLARYYVVAGDSLKIDMGSVFRLSPLRRNMYLDVQIDLFAFYVPHRHIYGSDWISFIKAGVNESTTLGTRTLTGATSCFATHTANGATVPKHIPEGYINIYNNYFKRPTATDYAANTFDALAIGHSDLSTGLPIGHLPRLWNTTVDALTVAADRRFALVDTDKIDLVTMGEKQGTFETLRQREFFARRYRDVLGNMFGATVNTDADQRPELLMHNSSWLTSHDIDGTDDATLGTSTGKAASVGEMHIPWKFFPEHGVVWILAALRFPPVHIKEVHYLDQKSEMSYADISGEPELYANKAPVTLNLTEYFTNASDTDAGIIPFGQWYREQPHFVHDTYAAIEGHPFIEAAFTNSAGQTDYIDYNDYENIFSSVALRHWQAQGHIKVECKSVVPDPRSSIFAGTR